MSIAGLFIHRPIGTALLALGVAVFGWAAFLLLPVAPLPQVEYPTINVKAQLPGADPVTVAKSLTTPLEKQLGRIAGLKQMTSSSTVGASNIVLQFELVRDINGAARDVQAALDSAVGLPADMPLNPVYTKSNPSDPPLVMLSLTSDTASRADIYEVASSVLQQKLMQMAGVGDVTIGGGALPSVRIELNPERLSRYQISFERIRAFIRGANVHQALGSLGIDGHQYQLAGNQSLMRADEFRPLVMTTADGAIVHLTDFATVKDSVEDINNFGIANERPAILLVVFKQPGANVVEAAENVERQLPGLRAIIPHNIDIELVGNRTASIKAALEDVELTLLMSIFLVVAITFLFFRDWRVALIPAVVVPLSLLGTFIAMFFLGFSLNILSLMALAISTGFVVDDAIVVTENIVRHLEKGQSPLQAALQGSKEIGFTVLSISISLVAVFIPILMMGGLVGRLFREFALCMTVAVLFSMVLSLTLTPVMCRVFLRQRIAADAKPASPANRFMHYYDLSLQWVLRHRAITLSVAAAVIVANVILLLSISKGFFPQEDIDKVTGVLVATQDIAFPELQQQLQDVVKILGAEKEVDRVVGFVGAGQLSNLGTVYIYLKSRHQRHRSADEIIEHLRGLVASVPGLRIYLQSSQNLVIGGRRAAAQYQYTLKAKSLEELSVWGDKVVRELRNIPDITQVNSNRANRGFERYVEVNRSQAQRMGVNMEAVDQTLYDMFGQRRVSTIYSPANQFRVVMEVDPRFQDSSNALNQVWVPIDSEVATQSNPARQIPLSAIASFKERRNYLLVSHTEQFPSETISFNLAGGTALSTATRAIETEIGKLNLPNSVSGQFNGSAEAYQESLHSMPILIGAAILVVYLVLGILYESFLHPLTILSTLPSAGVGALIMLMLCHIDLNIIAIIGIVLLIGIVKKNAIMLIDCALGLERHDNASPSEAIYRACIIRFRPILMTTIAAVLGAVPLIIGSGYGSEFRKPLGLSIIGGLIASQLLTVYTTPVVYLVLSQLRAKTSSILRKYARRRISLP